MRDENRKLESRYGVTQQRKWPISVSQNRFFVYKWCYKAGQERLMLFPAMKSGISTINLDFKHFEGRDNFKCKGNGSIFISSPSAWPMGTEFAI